MLQADAEAVVDAVNTVGVMGKGIALAPFRHGAKDGWVKRWGGIAGALCLK